MQTILKDACDIIAIKGVNAFILASNIPFAVAQQKVRVLKKEPKYFDYKVKTVYCNNPKYKQEYNVIR